MISRRTALGGVLAAVLSSAGARAGVLVRSDGACLDSLEVAHRLTAIIAEHVPAAAAQPSVLVDSAPGPAGTRLFLSLSDAHGRLLVDRQYDLLRADCSVASELLALVLRRYFAGADLAPTPPPEPSLSAGPAWYTGLGLSGHAPAIGVALTVRGGVDAPAASWRLGSDVLVRLASPTELGGGSVAMAEAMLRARAMHDLRAIRLYGGVGGGLRVVKGLAYVDNRLGALPALECFIGGDYIINDRWIVGVEASATPLVQSAQTTRGLSRTLPMVGAGLRLDYLWNAS